MSAAQLQEFQWYPEVFYYPGEVALPGIILSCGIHGNETGPIRSVQQLQRYFHERHCVPQHPLLIIYGNLEAIKSNKRFIRYNMNRLFQLDPAQNPDLLSSTEYQRAQLLEQCCAKFVAQHRNTIHVDLHSTIKPSLHPRFALQPLASQSRSPLWQTLRAGAQIDAWVIQTTASNTFSQFSSAALGVESITLECGDISSSDDKALFQALLNLVMGHSQKNRTQATTKIPHYRVYHEVIKKSEGFRFLVDEHSANFSTLTANTRVFTDGNGHIVDFECPLYSLFLNSNVPNGHRAGLLLCLNSQIGCNSDSGKSNNS